MNTRQIKIGSIMSYCSIAISIIINLLYTPVMIRILGQNEYGLYNTVASTISTLSVLNLGFGSSYIRFYSKFKEEDNFQEIKRLNGLFLLIFCCIGSIALVCGLFLTFNLHIVFSTGLTQDEYSVAGVLMLIMTINLALSFPLSVFTSIVSAHERFIFQKAVSIIHQVLSPLVTLPLLLMGYRSVAIVCVSFALTVLSGAINIYYVLYVLREGFSFRNINRAIVKSLFSFTFFIAINIIIDQINWNIDKILLGRYKGTSEVAIYSVGYILYFMYMQFSSSMSSMFTPRIHRIVNEYSDQKETLLKELTNIFTKVGRIQFSILLLVASGIVFFGSAFITCFWVGTGYEMSYYVALLLIIPATIPLIQNLGIEIQRAQNLHHFRSYIYLGMAVLNLIMSIFLCQIYGAVGSAIGTAVSLVIANGLVINIYYHKKCNIDIKCFWKSICSMLKGFILPCFAGIMVLIFTPKNSKFSFLIFTCEIIVYTVIFSFSFWKWSLNSDEKKLITSMVKRLSHKNPEK